MEIDDDPWQYIGKKVRVKYHDEPEWDSVIMAYNGSGFIVERIGGGDRVGIDRGGKQAIIPNNAWSVSWFQVELLEPPKPIRPITLYPHRCKVCSAPARINRAITLCSNTKCKAWKAIRKRAAISKAQMKPDRNKHGILLCPECGDICMGWNVGEAFCGPDLRPLKGRRESDDLYGHKHKWDHTWVDGDKYVENRGKIVFVFKGGQPVKDFSLIDDST